MNRLSRLLAATMPLVLSVFLLAPDAHARRQAAAPDAAEPKEAARRFFEAILTNDVATVRDASVGTEEETRTVLATAQVVGAQKKLVDTARAKYPNESQLLNGIRTPDFSAQLNEAEAKVEGDQATLTPKRAGAKPLRLRKLDGKWKVDLSTMQETPQRQQPEQLQKLSAAMDEVTSDINAGKYPTAQSALMALEQKVRALRADAAGGPSTQPSR